jgi:hypothetical protein
VLGWGNDHCRDGTGACTARKHALLRLHVLYGGGEDEGVDYALRLDRITSRLLSQGGNAQWNRGGNIGGGSG